MRPILHITWEYPPFVVGALSKYLSEIIPNIASQYTTVLVVRGDTDGVFESQGIKIYKVGSSVRTHPHILTYAHLLNLDLLRGAANALHENGGASLIHSHDWISSIASIYLSSYIGCPLFISVYTTEITRSHSLKSVLSLGIFDLERYCFQRAERVFVRDHQMRDLLVSEYGVDRGRIVLGNDPETILKTYRGILN
ncbi:MAG: glycosyltransferase [Candidatus Methanomethyliaceae archaeon]|nr:glycosyltransferase [Candidatus Methanomethyliaceae archaeon]